MRDKGREALFLALPVLCRHGGKDNIMKTFTDNYNLMLGSIVTVMTALFGVYWYVFAAYLFFNVADWLTGWYRSRKKKKKFTGGAAGGIKEAWLLDHYSSSFFNIRCFRKPRQGYFRH